MKKYKLQKWYPSLPNWAAAGDEICYRKHANGGEYYVCRKEPGGTYCVRLEQAENNPDFWELVDDRNQEYVDSKKVIFTTEDGVDIRHGGELWLVVNNKVVEWIHACKIGMKPGEIYFSTKELAQEYVESKKKPLLVTEDGVNIYIGTPYWYVDEKTLKIIDLPNPQSVGKVKGCLDFSTKELAQEYVDSKKPLFTTEDGVDVFDGEMYWFIMGGLCFGHATKGSLCPDTKRFYFKSAAERYLNGGTTKTQEYVDSKKPLFTTEDGVDVFGGEKYWYILNGEVIYTLHATERSFYGPDTKRFFLKSSAERYLNEGTTKTQEYVDSKKVIFVSNDGEEMFMGDKYWFTKKDNPEKVYYGGIASTNTPNRRGYVIFKSSRAAQKYIDSKKDNSDKVYYGEVPSFNSSTKWDTTTSTKQAEPINVLEQLKKVNEDRSIDGYGMELTDWKLSQWSNAVAGEVGELCNLCKKVDRGDYDDSNLDWDNVQTEIGKEAADIVIYLDLLCTRQGIDLGEAIVNKFNEVSDRVGSDIKIPDVR